MADFALAGETRGFGAATLALRRGSGFPSRCGRGLGRFSIFRGGCRHGACAFGGDYRSHDMDHSEALASQAKVWLEFSKVCSWDLSLIGSKKMCFFIANINQKDLVFLKDLLEAAKVAPAIDRRHPLSDVAEALRYLEEGHAQGKVVITVNAG